MADTTWLTLTVLGMAIALALDLVAYFRLAGSSRKEYYLLAILVAASLLSEVAALIGAGIFRYNMNLTNSIYSLFEGPLLLFLYRDRLKVSFMKSLTLILAASLLLFGLLDLFYLQGLFKINSYMKVVTSITMFVVSIVYFFTLIRDLPTESVTKLPMFWINTSFLTYFSGAFAAHLATNYLVYIIPEPTLETWIATWTIHNSMAILCYLGIGWAFVLERQRTKSRIEPAG